MIKDNIQKLRIKDQRRFFHPNKVQISLTGLVSPKTKRKFPTNSNLSEEDEKPIARSKNLRWEVYITISKGNCELPEIKFNFPRNQLQRCFSGGKKNNFARLFYDSLWHAVGIC